MYALLDLDMGKYEVYPFPYDNNSDGLTETTYFVKIANVDEFMLLTTKVGIPKNSVGSNGFSLESFVYSNVVVLADRQGNMISVLKKKQPPFKEFKGFEG